MGVTINLGGKLEVATLTLYIMICGNSMRTQKLATTEGNASWSTGKIK